MTLQNALERTFCLAVDLCAVCAVVAASGCSSCVLYQRHTADPTDPAPWYLAEVCHEGTPQQTITLVCSSKTRLKPGAKDCR